MSRNKHRLTLLVVTLLALQLACGLPSLPFLKGSASATPAVAAKPPAAATQAPAAGQSPAAPTKAPEKPAPTAALGALNVASGTSITTNANHVRGLAYSKGRLYAATLGGVVAWDTVTGKYQKFTTRDGLKHVSTYEAGLCAMPQETLVVATRTGISLFNLQTQKWDPAPLVAREATLENSQIYTALCDSAGKRIIFSSYGVSVFNFGTGEYKNYRDKEGVPVSGLDDFAVKGSEIWGATGYKGIISLIGDKITVYDESKGLPSNSVYSLDFSPDGILWAGTGKGLVKYANNQWKLYDSKVEGLFGDAYQVIAAPDKTIWVGSGSGRVCHFDPTSEKCVLSWKEPRGNYISGLALDDKGSPFVSTGSNGIWAYDGKEWKQLLIAEDVLGSNFVSSFANAPDGKLWVGTDNGVHLVDPAKPGEKWQTYSVSTANIKLTSLWAYAIQPLADGTVWFSVGNGQAVKFKDGAFTALEGTQAYSQNTIAVNSKGLVFLGSAKGLNIWDGSKWTSFTRDTGLPGGEVRALLAEGEAVYVGTNAGLVKYLDGKFEVVVAEKAPNLPSPYVARIFKEKDGKLLLGTFSGLVRWDGKEVSLVYKPAGNSSQITGIAYDNKNRLWVSTYDGAHYLEGGTWKRLTTKEGLASNLIAALHADAYGTIWIGAGDSTNGGGLTRIVP